ncbi:hypothetical protein XELAEV_18023552mg [Xenopus laevis]|uniref:Uncharacterized protein n=1 Tax=Xenopus laevis TaxID=8355 RepID=A0A974HP71_XENLA|nr:hypothetical protein XELAEV_18023552mg [Xenopus laevis]
MGRGGVGPGIYFNCDPWTTTLHHWSKNLPIFELCSCAVFIDFCIFIFSIYYCTKITLWVFPLSNLSQHAKGLLKKIHHRTCC